MRLTEVTYGTAKAVEGYGPGFFRVAGHVLRGPCLITPWDAGPWGGFDDTDAPLSLLGQIDVLFVGTGTSIAHVPPAFREVLEDVRFEAASQLMTLTELPLDDIADALGYAGVSPFTRAFRRRAGAAPGQWRREAIDRAAQGLAMPGRPTPSPTLAQAPEAAPPAPATRRASVAPAAVRGIRT